MSDKSLQDLNRKRSKDYYKDESDEQYLFDINRTLQKKETADYLDLEEEYPTIFVAGLPRSGTTLMSQIIAHSFDIGYINNFMARFWLAPVTGIKLYNIICKQQTGISFKSDYATTQNISDIHDFGYFWRYWLKKDTVDDTLRSAELEKSVNWKGLRKAVLNMHHTFNGGWICKNIFGAYHMKKLLEVFQKSFFVYIERDPLDVAISIIDARKKFYDDPSVWWSTIPYEYPSINGLSAEEQVAAQVVFLRKLYENEIIKALEDRIIRVQYKNATANPVETVNLIRERVKSLSGIKLTMRPGIPAKFPVRSYDTRTKEKEMFVELMKQFQ